MKQFVAIFLTISALCFASSCTKDNSVTPTAKAQKTIVADKTDVGQAD